MALSHDLTVIVEFAGRYLALHSEGSLILPLRKKIWAALGPRLTEGKRALHGIGLKRRTHLAILSVRYALPLWEQVWPNNDEPHQMLSIAEQCLDAEVDLPFASQRRDRFWTVCENLVGRKESSRAIYVGFAAAKTVSTALYDERFDPRDIDDSLMDDALDAYEWDAAFYAAASVANGFSWEDDSSPDKRSAFWNWYLKEAIPSACDIAS